MERLFRPLSLGSLRMKNRFVLAPMLTGLGDENGAVTSRQQRFYETVAEGGAGLLILEPLAVSPEGREHPHQLLATSSKSLEGVERIVRAVHARGAKAAIQLNHAGAAANARLLGSAPLAPFACLCPSRITVAKEMGNRQIEAVVRAFGLAAASAELAGADAIEIQAGQGYLLAQFLCPQTNLRQDAYGADRLLFARQVLHAVRSATKLPILLRVSCSRPSEGGKRHGILSMAALAETMDGAALDVAFGDACHDLPWFYLHASLPREPQEDLFRLLRHSTHLPIFAGGRLGTRTAVERFLKEDWGDAITLARPLVADPYLVNKWRRRQDEQIMACGGCLQGCLRHRLEGGGLSCTLNPFLAEEPRPPALKAKRILVVGGGPSGMTAAALLAERGHQVTLVEGARHLGGMLRSAVQHKPPLFHPLMALIHRVEASGVTVRLGHKADQALLNATSPEVLVWAVGATQIFPRIPGLRRQRIVVATDYFAKGHRPFGNRVLVLGATRLGLEAAEELAEAGLGVTIVESSGSVGPDMESVGRDIATQRMLLSKGLTIFTNTTVERFEIGRVRLSIGGQPLALPSFDWVLLSGGFRAKMEPPASWYHTVPEVHLLNTPKAATDLLEAVHSAFRLARQL